MSLITNSILEKLNSLIIVVDQDALIQYVSPSTKRVLGFEPEELLGNGWWNMTFDNEKEISLIKNLVFEQLKNDSLIELEPYERLLKTSSGSLKWILWNVSKGPENTLISVGHDITERKIIEQQIALRHKELELKNKEIVDSIQYASRIQDAILPNIKRIKKVFKDAFVFYQPKDLVSGDCYFFYERNNKAFVAVVDCTGHGVPGALMSVIAHGILKEVIVKKEIEEPTQILYAMDEELFVSLNKTSSEVVTYDGMDVSIGVFDFEKNTLTYAGAFRPMLLVRDSTVVEFEGSRYPIGFYVDVKKEFTSKKIELKEDDTFYFFTDGYCDQFGGEAKKKFNRKRFKELLLTAQEMEMDEQESFLQYALLNWQQDELQVDDILVLGIKI